MNDAKVSWMNSVTRQFGIEELLMLQYATPSNLIGSFRVSEPIIVLRALMELFGHGEFDKLRAVGAVETIQHMWQHANLEDPRDENFLYQLQVFFNLIPAEAVC